MGDLDEGFGALPHVFPVQISHPVFGHNIMRIGSRGHRSRAVLNPAEQSAKPNPSFAVEVTAITGLPPRLRAAPRIKSSCPPNPLTNLPPTESDTACPVRSISIAELIATTLSFCAMMKGSLV